MRGGRGNCAVWKVLVFESNLLELFQTCNKCLAPSAPRVEKAVGSMIVIVSKCLKGRTKTWASQRCDGKLPWGNMLCAAGTLFTGSNPARVAAFFKHNGVQYMSLRTYYKIQRVYLAPLQLIDAGKMSNCLFCSLFRAKQ